jgi:hypothetical protein
MCFRDEYELMLVDQYIGTARKKTAHCCECHEDLAGKPAQMLIFRSNRFNGKLDTWYECARCFVTREFIYRHERLEGCSDGQSLAPYGSREMQEWFDDRGRNERGVPQERRTWHHAWPETLEAAIALRDSLPEAGLPS